MSWDLLIDEAELAKLLPPAYSHFARPVKDGLVVFLSGLPQCDQWQILGEQAALPAAATLAQRLGLLAQRCPVLHKLGQVLARDQRLAAELREQLRPLESLPPTVPLDAIERILVDDLGPLAARGVQLLPPAIAEASVAVVIPFRDRRLHEGGEGVFKILKPGIKQRMEFELDLLTKVGEHLDARCDDLSIPQLNYRETFELVRERLLVEVQLATEQQHLAEARELFADEPDVQIPALLEHCTWSVTAMERVFGEKVTDHTLDLWPDRRRLARLVVRTILAQPMFARTRCSMFHSDPHAGNLIYTREHQLAILDWSLVGHLGERERVLMGQVVLAAICLRRDLLLKLLVELDERKATDLSALKAVIEKALEKIRRGHFPGIVWLVDLLDDATQSARLRVSADMLLFRKTLHTLDGVVHELSDGDVCLEDELLAEFALQFCLEWPERWLASPHSRSFATRLANADLVDCALQIPFAAARYMQGRSCEMLK